MRVSNISKITFTYLCRSCLPPCTIAVLKLTGLSPKFQKVSNLQDSQERKKRETPTEGMLCTLLLTRNLRLALARQLNSSLEVALVLDLSVISVKLNRLLRIT